MYVKSTLYSVWMIAAIQSIHVGCSALEKTIILMVL